MKIMSVLAARLIFHSAATYCEYSTCAESENPFHWIVESIETVLYSLQYEVHAKWSTAVRLKGIVTRDFRPPIFSWFEPIWAPDKQPKVFSISVSFSPRYSITKWSLQCAAHHGDDLRGVHHTTETISAVCCTPQKRSPQCASHFIFQSNSFVSKSSNFH